MGLLAPDDLALPAQPDPEREPPEPQLDVHGHDVVVHPAEVVGAEDADALRGLDADVPRHPADAVAPEPWGKGIQVGKRGIQAVAAHGVDVKGGHHPVEQAGVDEKHIEKADRDGEDGDGVQEKALGQRLQPPDDEVHQDDPRHADEGDALEAQIEEQDRKGQVGGPLFPFLEQQVVQHHQPEAEGQVVDLQGLHRNVGVHTAGLGKSDEAGDEGAEAEAADRVEEEDAEVRPAHAVKGEVDDLAAEEVGRRADRCQRDDVVQNGRAAAGHIVQLLEIQRPDQHRPARHHEEGDDEDDVIFADGGQSTKIPGDEQEERCHAHDAHL